MLLPSLQLPPTSQVPDKVLQHHLAVGLDVGAVHVGVEQDDGEGQDEDGVRVVELLHHFGVAHAVALAAAGTRVGHEGPALPRLQRGAHSGTCLVLEGGLRPGGLPVTPNFGPHPHRGDGAGVMHPQTPGTPSPPVPASD